MCRKVNAGEPLGRGTVTVIGDAAHPTTPALGQVCMRGYLRDHFS